MGGVKAEPVFNVVYAQCCKHCLFFDVYMFFA